ncbi:MAG: CRISPR-associated protein [Planctomycetes bacterium]|nr:CRISPR-associated protein [Planctomycetota bacterium]
MSKIDVSTALQPQLLAADGPVCLIVKATLSPIAGLDRFQPAGFPEIGQVIYDAPKQNGEVNATERVCIVDSPASMANHLETVCLEGAGDLGLHSDLMGLPYVICVTDPANGPISFDANDSNVRPVVSTFTEGHRLASDYFLDGKRIVNGDPEGRPFRDVLREGFKIVEVRKDKTYFITSDAWWDIFKIIFQYDPNSLVHGVMFAREQIKISRVLTAHMEALGARRVGRSGVKFDRLGKTTSGQPIFSVDDETAHEIRATFILDLALLRSFGRDNKGLSSNEKHLLLDLALWKIVQLLRRPFRFRTQCHLRCDSVRFSTEEHDDFTMTLPKVNIASTIRACDIRAESITRVYYPASELFKAGKETETANIDDEEEAVEMEE